MKKNNNLEVIEQSIERLAWLRESIAALESRVLEKGASLNTHLEIQEISSEIELIVREFKSLSSRMESVAQRING